MKWVNVQLIWLRELRDQMRDRRTLFTVAVLPILLYPLMGMVVLQVSQFKGTQTTRIWVIGEEELPPSPPLIVNLDGQRGLFGGDVDAESNSLLRISVDEAAAANLKTEVQVQAAAERAIASGDFDAVVYFPPTFSEQLADALAGKSGASVPQPRIYSNTSKDKSRIAHNRMESALAQWRNTIGHEALEKRGIPITAIHSFEVTSVDVAEESSRRAHVWAKILPFVLMIWALTGAFYPAIDLCAGEKERGTLETLLTSPAQRNEIVWGKLLAVTSFSIATAILNLLSLCVTGTFVMRAVAPTGGVADMSFGPPPLTSIGWLLVALVPAALMFSALALAIAAMARSSKEGQYYLMPLLLISLPLMILPILPAAELTLGTALVPITGLVFVLRELIEGEYVVALRYALPVVGVTMFCMWLSIRWAIDQFNKEEVLFRESEQFSVKAWLTHLVRDRLETPTLGAALFMGALLLVIRFFSMLLLPPPETWTAFTITTLITLAGLIAAPAVLAALVLTSNPRRTLLLTRPPMFSVIAAFLLAILFQPLVQSLGEVVKFVFPIGEATAAQFAVFQELIDQAPGMWAIVLLLALTPAICEELAFRGFILSGLRHMGHKWGAIALSAVMFGVAHGLLQQSLMACLTGMVIGYIAVQSGSLLPCIAYHFANNAAAILCSTVDADLIAAWPVLNHFFTPVEEGFAFAWWVVIAGSVFGAGLLYWFARQPHQASAEEQLQDALDHQQASVGA